MNRIYSSLFTVFCLTLTICTSCQEKTPHPSPLQYPAGYPSKEATALQQLKNYPLPRYYPANHLMRLFNWINPNYLASGGMPGVKRKDVISTSYLLQQELITDWNYGIIIPNAGTAFRSPDDTVIPSVIRLANNYFDVPLDVITFWTQGQPKVLGYKQVKPMISGFKIDSSYIKTFNRDGREFTEIKFNFPDSLISIDGEVQKFYLSKILKYLKRPISRINENGEEPPGPYLIQYLSTDAATIKMKDSMGIDSWSDFAATRKLQMRNAYSSSFMKELPELKNTFFSFYSVDGGPIDRFKWSIMKKCMTQVNGIYYSTPDFYPRWPNNWKDWQGAWHGWKWIEIGRKNEIKDGDYLFSPFVAAGWSKKNEDNITPGQWLGLLKCLSVIGAEFYYVGYFNLSPPFSNPADYVWQEAIPAYAQAITSRFEDVLKDGNVLFDENNEPIISYPTDDRHVLIAARKQNNKEKYVICGTYQPFSNDSDEIPEKRNVTTTINGHTLSFEIRRQGSVYIYEKTPDSRIIFYQLDKWHENAHPDHWTKDFCFEAEVADSGVSSENIYMINSGTEGDYTNFISYVHFIKNTVGVYNFCDRDSVNQNRFLWVYCKGTGVLSASLLNAGKSSALQKSTISSEKWKWVKIAFPQTYNFCGGNTLRITAPKGEVDIDKFVITNQGNTNPSY